VGKFNIDKYIEMILFEHKIVSKNLRTPFIMSLRKNLFDIKSNKVKVFLKKYFIQLGVILEFNNLLRGNIFI